MKPGIIVTNIIIIALFVVGCHHTSQMNLLTKVESFLPSEPDSADALLNIVDEQNLYNREEQTLYSLLRTMTDAMQGITPPNDTLVHQAYNYYQRKSDRGNSSDHTSVRRFAQSALYLGDWYAAVDSIKDSEDCYRQAIKFATKAQDWHTCYIAYSCLAEQIQWGNEDEALRLIESAITIYGKCKDNSRNLVSLYEYAAHYSSQIAYRNKTSFKTPLGYAYKAYRLAKDSCYADYYNQTHILLAEIYWTMGDYHRALDYVRNIRLENLDSEPSIATNMKIAQYYLSCDSISKAKELYQAPKTINDKKLTYLFARGLAETSVHLLSKDSILFYMDSAFTAAENMLLDAFQVKDDYYQDNLEKEKKNERLIYRDKLKTWIFGGVIFFILISSLLIGRVLVLRIRVHRAQNERREEEARHLQQEMELLQDRQQALEDSHQKKTAAIKHLQRYIIDRTDTAMKLKDDTARVRMSAKEWADVEQLLDEIDDGRMSKIRARFKNLSSDDIHLCVMVRIGMSNPAIGNVYAITPSAVQHRKLALKKKGFGVVDPDVTLDDFIESL